MCVYVLNFELYTTGNDKNDDGEFTLPSTFSEYTLVQHVFVFLCVCVCNMYCKFYSNLKWFLFWCVNVIISIIIISLHNNNHSLLLLSLNLSSFRSYHYDWVSYGGSGGQFSELSLKIAHFKMPIFFLFCFLFYTFEIIITIKMVDEMITLFWHLHTKYKTSYMTTNEKKEKKMVILNDDFILIPHNKLCIVLRLDPNS